MGDNANLVLEYSPVSWWSEKSQKIWVYTHWDGSDLPKIVADALERGRSRWEDEPYLARILTSAVFKAAGIDNETGAGIAPYPQGSEDQDVTVALDVQAVSDRTGQYSFEEWIKRHA